nr:MAG TPA: hypothetical protein [Caudoviricetes sp.]
MCADHAPRTTLRHTLSVPSPRPLLRQTTLSD